MKRIVVVIVVVALAVLAVWIVATGQNSRPSGAPIPVGDGEGFQGAPGSTQMAVVGIVDGDTLRLQTDVSTNGFPDTFSPIPVRLIGIDTPEVHPVLECYGAEAETELTRLVPVGSLVYVMPDEDPRDDYDRYLMYLWTEDGTFVNLELVAGGFAEAIRVAPNDAWYDELRDAEDVAARAGRGMWGQC